MFRTTIWRTGSNFLVQQNRCVSHARFAFSPVRHGQGKRSRSKFVVKVVKGALSHVSLAADRHFAMGLFRVEPFSAQIFP